MRFANSYGFFEVTQEEWEQLKREIEARVACGDNTLMDRIIAELLLNSNP